MSEKMNRSSENSQKMFGYVRDMCGCTEKAQSGAGKLKGKTKQSD